MGTHLPLLTLPPHIQKVEGVMSKMHHFPLSLVADEPHSHVNDVSKFSVIRAVLFVYLELGVPWGLRFCQVPQLGTPVCTPLHRATRAFESQWRMGLT